MTMIKAYAAYEAGEPLAEILYDAGAIDPHEVEIAVESCGLCHSDLAMINNDWRASQYPLVAGHEVIGRITALGSHVKHLELGQMVGVGWNSHSCMHCSPCLSGRQQRCQDLTITVLGRGGFADHIRVQDIWAVPLPKGIDAKSAGPLFCGGITVFAPLLDYGVKPTDKVGVIGIGGLGHLALQMTRAWGCEVTAFTSSADKINELKGFGAHHVVNSRDKVAVHALRGKFDFILSTVDVKLPWNRYMSALAPEGQLITVGMVKEPMAISAGALISGQKSVGGSDTGSPDIVAKMLEFCVRHDIKPMVEYFPMSDINAAIKHLESGKARYRVVLTND